MLRKRKNPSTEISTGERELIARLVGPLRKRGISRQVFCDCLAEADTPVPKASLDRWVHDYTQARTVVRQTANAAAPLLDTKQQEGPEELRDALELDGKAYGTV